MCWIEGAYAIKTPSFEIEEGGEGGGDGAGKDNRLFCGLVDPVQVYSCCSFDHFAKNNKRLLWLKSVTIRFVKVLKFGSVIHERSVAKS